MREAKEMFAQGNISPSRAGTKRRLVDVLREESYLPLARGDETY